MTPLRPEFEPSAFGRRHRINIMSDSIDYQLIYNIGTVTLESGMLLHIRPRIVLVVMGGKNFKRENGTDRRGMRATRLPSDFDGPLPWPTKPKTVALLTGNQISANEVISFTYASVPYLENILGREFYLHAHLNQYEALLGSRHRAQESVPHQINLPGIYIFVEAATLSIVHLGKSERQMKFRIYHYLGGGVWKLLRRGDFSGHTWGPSADRQAIRVIEEGAFEIILLPVESDDVDVIRVVTASLEVAIFGFIYHRLGKLPGLDIQRQMNIGEKAMDAVARLGVSKAAADRLCRELPNLAADWATARAPWLS